jgi:predicted Zn-dependent protease
MALGNVLVSVREYREAAQHYKVIPKDARQYRDAQYGLAVCVALGNDPYAAIPYLIETLETDITHELAFARLMETLRDEKDYARMEEYALRRMQYPPYPEWLHVALAEVYQQAGDEARAKQHLNKFENSLIDHGKEAAFWGVVKGRLTGDTTLIERSIEAVGRHSQGMGEYLRRQSCDGSL